VCVCVRALTCVRSRACAHVRALTCVPAYPRGRLGTHTYNLCIRGETYKQECSGGRGQSNWRVTWRNTAVTWRNTVVMQGEGHVNGPVNFVNKQLGCVTCTGRDVLWRHCSRHPHRERDPLKPDGPQGTEFRSWQGDVKACQCVRCLRGESVPARGLATKRLLSNSRFAYWIYSSIFDRFFQHLLQPWELSLLAKHFADEGHGVGN
jgi:hypothetical protein